MELAEAIEYFNRFKNTMGEDFVQDCILSFLESNSETVEDLKEIYRKNRNHIISENYKLQKEMSIYDDEGVCKEYLLVDKTTEEFNEGTRLKDKNIIAAKNLIRFNAMSNMLGIRLPQAKKNRKRLRNMQKKGTNIHNEIFLTDDDKEQLKSIEETSKMIDKLNITGTYRYCVDGNKKIKQIGINSLTYLSRMGRSLNRINGHFKVVFHKQNQFQIDVIKNLRATVQLKRKGY